jgi:hypothetical protein
LWAERPPEMREGARRAVKPPVAKRKVARKAVKPPAAKRRPRAQAGQDFASNGFLALPVAKEAAKATITPERTETIQDLYEMATGLPAFSGNTLATVFDTILHKAPTSAVRLNPNLPVEPEQIKTRRWRKTASWAIRALRKWAGLVRI